MILVTGGAGFIGANFVQRWLRTHQEAVLNVDSLTYAGNPANLRSLAQSTLHRFVQGDVGDRALVRGLLNECDARAVVHFAAETHVDRSIEGPDAFVQTNIVGTFALLEAVRAHWEGLTPGRRQAFRFLHVSTDEVYGSLEPDEAAFTESSPCAPNSPYAASKAASDHLVRAYHHTYGLPTLTTRCSNNFGPRQHPEKLIPRMLRSALGGEAMPLYGDGTQVRDWLFVDDHCAALEQVLASGVVGGTYNIGGRAERRNVDVVHALCKFLDEERPRAGPDGYVALITPVADRRGHDRRYAMDISRIERELGWTPTREFSAALRTTVRWYLDNPEWMDEAMKRTKRESPEPRG